MDLHLKPSSRSSFDWKKLVYNLAFFLNGLLIFLLIFESRLTVPYWMQAIGRMHPLVLHFPLVVLLLYAFWIIIIEKPESARWNAELAETLLLIGTFTAVIAAFSGFILSKEDGYESDTLFWHKWLGVAISVVSIVWYSFVKNLDPWKIPAKAIAISFIILLSTGGHLGGNLTHGEDFLVSPLQTEPADENTVAFEDAAVYADLVQPVLQQKCYACHNAEKSKGDLQMQTKELLVKGGKSGMLWDTTKADLGLMLSRVHLPLDDKKHMPPRGKVQLTDEEIILLAEWVKSGSDFEQKVNTLSPASPIYSYAQNMLGGKRNEEIYEFTAADPEKVKELNTTYRLIKPISAESPALFANFYNKAAFKSSDISDLLPLKEQLVSMDLSKMPVKDEDLKTIAQFPELRKLLLNFTDIQGNTLGELKKLTKLHELSLSGTGVKLAQVKELDKIPSLKKVYVWSTGLSTEELAELRKVKKISYETGFRSDTVILALTPPLIENEEQILKGNTPITMKHQIPGTTIRYTLDGTMPDSTSSPVYNKPLTITKNTKITAKAFKNGWYGSKPVDKFFFKSAFRIDSVHLLTQPDPKYKGKGNVTLSDGVKSAREQGSGNWLGYRDSDFQSYFFFNKPVNASSITVSMLRNVGGFIFPPTRIEVWGGANEKSVKLLKVITPTMPDKETKNVDDLVFEADFQKQDISCIKIIAKPLGKLPAWHPGKGEKAWVFVDEVIVN
ncbi:chitobiase/beta-hexosaminidase C-terminal domain-containing protein [Dyadobacter sp. CY323]|uniref:chitobiase/beta-hexosaminidase C-terminal domain-containing protein n=1 Tax=Dyadobacter sp. CY323 TaxID=2907302 RepID=UPI001F1F05F2|nr:chitobiase/beta-hexosaminidase C-terminal domain-containing protein [Dyadobacter sp. CY323]MCE6988820.1 chitobiase/beta-hexosaminidase C-terminal domain-containing protein [Dyadobacter sp. CY323]